MKWILNANSDKIVIIADNRKFHKPTLFGNILMSEDCFEYLSLHIAQS